MSHTSVPKKITLVSWGAFGNTYRYFVESNDAVACRALKTEFCKAMASAEALKEIFHTLTEDQKAIVSKTITAELTLQGY